VHAGRSHRREWDRWFLSSFIFGVTFQIYAKIGTPGSWESSTYITTDIGTIHEPKCLCRPTKKDYNAQFVNFDLKCKNISVAMLQAPCWNGAIHIPLSHQPDCKTPAYAS